MKMNTFGRYLLYRLKSTAPRTTMFAILSLIMTLNVVSSSIQGQYIEYNSTGIYMLALILGIFCTIIPILETVGFKNRHNLDTLYFFPLERKKLALVHYLSGLIQVLAIYTVTFVAAYIYLAANTNYFALHHMPIYYLLSVLLGIVMYSFFIFVFGQANTAADGALFSLLWVFALCLIILAATAVWNELDPITINLSAYRYRNALYGWGIAYAPINNLTVIFQDLIEVNQNNSHSVYPSIYTRQWYMFAVWGVIGIASAIGYFITFVKKGAQKAGEISDSPFGPFERRGVILQQDDKVARGAGHHSVVYNKRSDKYYIIYHRRPIDSNKRDNRVTCIEEMHFDENGDILPVVMTHEGVRKDKL